MFDCMTRALCAQGCRCAVAALVIAWAGASDARADLLGDEVEWWSFSQLNGEETLKDSAVVVDPFFEFIEGFSGFTVFAINLSSNSIRIDVASAFFSPWFDNGNQATYLEIRDLDWIGEPDMFIESVNVTFSDDIGISGTAPNGFAPFSADKVTFTDDSVRIAYGGHSFASDAFIQVDLVTVPSPAPGVLLACGGLLVARRRR